MARGLLTLTLTTAASGTPSPEFPSDPPPAWTPSPRDLTPPPRDTLLTLTTATDTTDSSTARGLLTLTLTTAASGTPSPEFPSDPPPAWTPSPRDLTPPPRDTLLTLTTDTDTT